MSTALESIVARLERRADFQPQWAPSINAMIEALRSGIVGVSGRSRSESRRFLESALELMYLVGFRYAHERIRANSHPILTFFEANFPEAYAQEGEKLDPYQMYIRRRDSLLGDGHLYSAEQVQRLKGTYYGGFLIFHDPHEGFMSECIQSRPLTDHFGLSLVDWALECHYFA